MSSLCDHLVTVDRAQPMRIIGRIAGVRGLTVLVEGLPIPIGSLVSIREPDRVLGSGASDPCVVPMAYGEVVGFDQDAALVMLLGQSSGIRRGDAVVGEQSDPRAPVGEGLLGRVVDGLARPIDGGGAIERRALRPLSPEPVGALSRSPIREPLLTGVRAIDLMTPLGRGQRMGLFAGPGVGKSTLLGSIARGTSADVSVIALIGERGREVREFVEDTLGDEGKARSVVVAATGDESPLMRIRAARLACAAAEHFRDQGLDVLLMMDSVTRFAHAQRQVGLSAGEPPTTRGYTPSVFAQMALLLERAGTVDRRDGRPGSITGLYTVLVEGDDMTEPVADAARGILDGHLMLSRRLAQRGHYPAIDVLDSVSRVARSVTGPEHMRARDRLISLLATYREVEDLVQIGAYARGASRASDIAIDFEPRINALLRQDPSEAADFAEALDAMLGLEAASSPGEQDAQEEG